MFTQIETGEMPKSGITRRQLMKGSTCFGMAVAAGSSISGLLGPTSASASSSVRLSGTVICLTPGVTRCFALECNEGYGLHGVLPDKTSADLRAGSGTDLSELGEAEGAWSAGDLSFPRRSLRGGGARCGWLRENSRVSPRLLLTIGCLCSISERFRLLEVACERHGPGAADGLPGGLAERYAYCAFP